MTVYFNFGPSGNLKNNFGIEPFPMKIPMPLKVFKIIVF